ncbi:MAG: YbhB/YbcL family Raf kinase inhibitor-like protein [Sandaracinaceae bacterium]|nr:YbhB/YbcL family Raf kinase inhibitor-like protein [Sandaracinaceae bacterium]
MILSSSAFAHGDPIPARHTCDGDDVSPPLAWTGVPASARSLALVVADPDAPDPAHPRTTWTHWVLYDLPPRDGGLEEGAGAPPSARDGLNDWGRTGWGGPCPPIGRHRYFFELYALDVVLGDGPLRRGELLEATREHVLAKATLMGTYERTRRR